MEFPLPIANSVPFWSNLCSSFHVFQVFIWWYWRHPACAAPVVMWHHLWERQLKGGAEANANKNCGIHLPSPILLAQACSRYLHSNKKKWHSQELCHHHLACQHNGCFTSWYYTWHKPLCITDKAFDNITTQQTSNSLTKGVRWIFCMPQVRPLQSWRKRTPTETILLICASGDWWVKHHSLRATCLDLKTFAEGQECCWLIKHDELEYFGKTLQEGKWEHWCRRSVILKMRVNTGLPMEKNKERKKNNSREKLFFETNQRILDAPGPASSKSINCMRPAKSQNSRSQSDDGTFWKTNIVKC